MEFVCKMFPGFISLGTLEEIQILTELRCELDGSSSCQCTTTLYGENEGTLKNCRILQQLRIVLADSRSDVPFGRLSFLGPASEKNGTELVLISRTEFGTRLLNK